MLFQKWRQFCMQFEHEVEDYNMGTLMRLDASEDISENNTTLGKDIFGTLFSR